MRLIRAAEDRQAPKRRAAKAANAARDACKELLAVKPLPALRDLVEGSYTNAEWKVILKHKLAKNTNPTLQISKLKNRAHFLRAMRTPAIYNYPTCLLYTSPSPRD